MSLHVVACRYMQSQTAVQAGGAAVLAMLRVGRRHAGRTGGRRLEQLRRLRQHRLPGQQPAHCRVAASVCTLGFHCDRLMLTSRCSWNAMYIGKYGITALRVCQNNNVF